MSVRYRSLVAVLGAFVLLGGLFALAFAMAIDGAGKWRAVAGAVVALLLGLVLMIGAVMNWMPGWLRRLVD